MSERLAVGRPCGHARRGARRGPARRRGRRRGAAADASRRAAGRRGRRRAAADARRGTSDDPHRAARCRGRRDTRGARCRAPTPDGSRRRPVSRRRAHRRRPAPAAPPRSSRTQMSDSLSVLAVAIDTNATRLPSGDTRPATRRVVRRDFVGAAPDPSAATTNSCHAPFGARCENTMRPSRVHDGQRSSPGIDGDAPRPRRPWPARSRVELAVRARRERDRLAVRRPRGIALGGPALSAAVTTRFASLPSGVIVQIASNQVDGEALAVGRPAALRARRSGPAPVAGGLPACDGEAARAHSRSTAAATRQRATRRTSPRCSRHRSPAGCRSVTSSRSSSLTAVDDGAGGDAVAVEQLVGRAAARNLAHGETLARGSPVPDGLAHRVAEAAVRVVILDGDDRARRRARRRR